MHAIRWLGCSSASAAQSAAQCTLHNDLICCHFCALDCAQQIAEAEAANAKQGQLCWCADAAAPLMLQVNTSHYSSATQLTTNDSSSAETSAAWAGLGLGQGLGLGTAGPGPRAAHLLPGQDEG
jgi:hypothetical protein